MHVVVTGGAGFIGSHLVDALLAEDGHTVVVLDNLRRGRLANLARYDGDRRFRFVLGDVRDVDQVGRMMAGADTVFHLAAQSNVLGATRDPRYSFETNVCGTFNVLEAARQQDVRRVVFTSSREAYGDAVMVPAAEEHPLAARNTYGASKVAGEIYCRTFTTVFGLETAVLRLTNVYGPRDTGRVIPIWIERALHGEPLEVFGGTQVMDFVWVDLVVEALMRAATADIVGLPINVGSGSGTPILDLARRILAITGSASHISPAPARHAEVTRFVADVTRLRERLDLIPDADPLEHLTELVATPVGRGT
jgi:UDP-glucose 4-epimerase